VQPGEWREAGPFDVWFPAGSTAALPHEEQAIGVRKHGEALILGCSRQEWMELVAAVKAGGLDTEVPG
jgi:hypothetical protein